MWKPHNGGWKGHQSTMWKTHKGGWKDHQSSVPFSIRKTHKGGWKRATKGKFTNAANVIQVRVFHVKAPQWWMEGPPVYHVKNPQRWMEGPPKASCCQVMSFLEANMPISIQRKAPNTVVTSGSKVKPVNPKQIHYLNNTTFAFLVFLPGWYDGWGASGPKTWSKAQL